MHVHTYELVCPAIQTPRSWRCLPETQSLFTGFQDEGVSSVCDGPNVFIVIPSQAGNSNNTANTMTASIMVFGAGFVGSLSET